MRPSDSQFGYVAGSFRYLKAMILRLLTLSVTQGDSDRTSQGERVRTEDAVSERVGTEAKRSDEAECSVWMYPDKSGSNPYQRELKESLTEIDVTVEMAEYGRYLPLLEKFFKSGRPDAVHVHWLSKCFVTENALLTAVLGLRLLFELSVLRLCGVRTVWTVHNRLEHERRSPRVELVVKRVSTFLFSRLIVHCATAVETVSETYGLSPRQQRKLVAIPHGPYVDSYPNEIARPKARDQLGYSPQDTVFCFFGLIRPYKNVPALIETFREMSTPNARLLIVGNPVGEDIERKIRTEAATDDRVQTVLEFVPDEEIQTYLNAADVAVLPYRDILTSGTAILAMSFGRPVVAPAVGCVGELLETDANILYDPNDSGGLATSMETALDRNLDVMGKQNREQIGRLSWDDIARQTRALYRTETTQS